MLSWIYCLLMYQACLVTPIVQWWSSPCGVAVWQPSHAAQWEGVAVAQVVQTYEEDDLYNSLVTVQFF